MKSKRRFSIWDTHDVWRTPDTNAPQRFATHLSARRSMPANLSAPHQVVSIDKEAVPLWTSNSATFCSQDS